VKLCSLIDVQQLSILIFQVDKPCTLLFVCMYMYIYICVSCVCAIICFIYIYIRILMAEYKYFISRVVERTQRIR